MSSDTTATQIRKAIKPIYKPFLEEDMYKSLISQFYHHNADEFEVEKILTELYNSIDANT